MTNLKERLAKPWVVSPSHPAFKTLEATMNDHAPSLMVTTVAPCVKRYFEQEISKTYKAMEYERRVRRKASVAWAYDGALNGGRDQEDWLYESNRNLAMFLGGDCPDYHMDNARLEHPDTPKWVVRRIKMKRAVLRAAYTFQHADSVSVVKWTVYTFMALQLLFLSIALGVMYVVG
ncbi:hypothetical protein [Vibrio phage V-YDF132]|nr:hypothetical protein [Vibrio phage V-YDF132]